MSVDRPAIFRDPIQFLAFGFGSGLSPKAPGTMGTLAAIPLFLLLSHLPQNVYTFVVAATFVLGVWICERASKALGVHDHPGIVWDEFVGFWVTMWAVPVTWYWVVLGFVLFRIFDIAKPWPIGWLDRRARGGLGIMLDDLVAGVMAGALLHLAVWAWAEFVVA